MISQPEPITIAEVLADFLRRYAPNLPVPNYENKNDDSKRETIWPVSENPARSRDRERQNSDVEAKGELVENQTKSQAQSEGGARSGGKIRQGNQAIVLFSMSPTDGEEASARPSRRLQQEIRRYLALPKLSQQICPCLVLAESPAEIVPTLQPEGTPLRMCEARESKGVTGNPSSDVIIRHSSRRAKLFDGNRNRQVIEKVCKSCGKNFWARIEDESSAKYCGNRNPNPEQANSGGVETPSE